MGDGARAAPQILMWGGGQCIGRCMGVNTVKTLNLKKMGVHDPPLLSFYGGATTSGYPNPGISRIQPLITYISFHKFLTSILPLNTYIYPLKFASKKNLIAS